MVVVVVVGVGEWYWCWWGVRGDSCFTFLSHVLSQSTHSSKFVIMETWNAVHYFLGEWLRAAQHNAENGVYIRKSSSAREQ